ncbi:MAG: serine hydrolase domain-containing protein [Myxococcota bacterium]
MRASSSRWADFVRVFAAVGALASSGCGGTAPPAEIELVVSDNLHPPGSAFSGNQAEYAAAFAAKEVCSRVFLAKEDPEPTLNNELRFIALLAPGFSIDAATVNVDEVESRVSVSLPDEPTREAVYAGSQGCIIVPTFVDGIQFEPQEFSWEGPDDDAPWPLGETVVPGESTIDRDALQNAIDVHMERADIRAIAVVHQGELVGEAYAPGYGMRVPQRAWSTGKSVASTFVGRLVDRGFLELDEPVPVAAWANDTRSSITLRDMVRMSSGLAQSRVGGLDRLTPESEHDFVYFDGFDTLADAVAVPAGDPPGETWAYRNVNVLVATALARLAVERNGGDAYASIQREVFEPLGMRSSTVETDAYGNFITSGQFFTTARDLARLGLVFEQGGVFGGELVLSEEWVSFATAPSDTFDGYGAFWWRNVNGNIPGAPRDAYYASGAFGQFSIVVPSRELVIAQLAMDPLNDFDNFSAFVADVVSVVDGNP